MAANITGIILIIRNFFGINKIIITLNIIYLFIIDNNIIFY